MRNRTELEMLQRDLKYVEYMIDMINQTFEHAATFKKLDVPIGSSLWTSSIAMTLSQIGEVFDQSKLSPWFIERYQSQLNMKLLKGFRNVIIHNYGNIDYEILDNVVINELQPILESILVIHEDLESLIKQSEQ